MVCGRLQTRTWSHGLGAFCLSCAAASSTQPYLLESLLPRTLPCSQSGVHRVEKSESLGFRPATGIKSPVRAKARGTYPLSLDLSCVGSMNPFRARRQTVAKPVQKLEPFF